MSSVPFAAQLVSICGLILLKVQPSGETPRPSGRLPDGPYGPLLGPGGWSHRVEQDQELKAGPRWLEPLDPARGKRGRPPGSVWERCSTLL